MSAKPVVYFIDDSATMREVIKIAFRREDLDVITCHDASSAIDMMDHSAPNVVITDVIMPGRDGYEVCQYIKQHPRLRQTPVILMSGVVNKGVAERAFAVHANELIRKPFQPQDLIARVRHLLSAPVLEAEPATARAARRCQRRAEQHLQRSDARPRRPSDSRASRADRCRCRRSTPPPACRRLQRPPAQSRDANAAASRCAFDRRHRGGRHAASRGGAAGLHPRRADHRIGAAFRAAAAARTRALAADARQLLRCRQNAAGNPAPAQPDQKAGG